MRERPRRVPVGERRGRLKRRPIDIGRRVRAQHVAVAVVAVDAHRTAEARVEVRITGTGVRQIARRADRSERTARSELGDARYLPVLDDRPHDRIAASRPAIRAKRHVVHDDGVPYVRLIVDADRPVLLEVVARFAPTDRLRPAERVVERHRQAVVGPALFGRELQRVIVRSRDVAVNVGDRRILRKRPQHLRNGAREVRVGERRRPARSPVRPRCWRPSPAASAGCRARDTSARAGSHRSRARCRQGNRRGCRRTTRRR